MSTCETDNILMKVLFKTIIGDSSYQPMKEIWSKAGSPGQNYRRLSRSDANDTEIQTLQHLRTAGAMFVILLSHCVHNRCTWMWCFVVYRKHAVIYCILIIGKHHLVDTLDNNDNCIGALSCNHGVNSGGFLVIIIAPSLVLTSLFHPDLIPSQYVFFFLLWQP